MMDNTKVLAIIPARGNSKGIPRKNLRPLNGRPLIYYSIHSALNAKYINKVIVSTDDEEIALFAERFGAEVLMRPKDLATDEIPLDPVIIHVVKEIEKKYNDKYSIILTIQPTAPLITSYDIDQFILKFKNQAVDTLLTATEDRHLRWIAKDNKFVPDYKARVNRQFLPETYRETGAIIGCKRNVIESGTRIGENISLYIMDSDKSIDIDTSTDFWLCEMLLKRKKIVFVVIGNRETGLGHTYRAITLAHELIYYEIIFLCTVKDDLAKDIIKKNNYSVEIVADKKDILDKIISISPNLVINDILDTSSDYILKLKKSGIKVVNFEDLGLGAEVADLVINALYPHQIPQDHILVGPKYFCLRDEFLHVPPKEKKENVNKVLITFGGTDEGNLTCRVLKILNEFLLSKKIDVDVVLGPGYAHHCELDKLIRNYDSLNINKINHTNRISEYMIHADLAITSAGRTLLELISLCVPTIVIAQNFRETTHKVASSEYGIVNLGYQKEVKDETILKICTRIISDTNLRETMIKKMMSLDLKSGKKEVIQKINSLLMED